MIRASRVNSKQFKKIQRQIQDYEALDKGMFGVHEILASNRTQNKVLKEFLRYEKGCFFNALASAVFRRVWPERSYDQKDHRYEDARTRHGRSNVEKRRELRSQV
jgi:hypothetical protein